VRSGDPDLWYGPSPRSGVVPPWQIVGVALDAAVVDDELEHAASMTKTISTRPVRMALIEHRITIVRTHA
jgi:hypothetical protein